MEQNGIAYVKKEENLPSAPQIRPIENYWGILKMKVYEGNWSAKNREALIRRIKMKQKEINQDIVIKMFEKLKQNTLEIFLWGGPHFIIEGVLGLLLIDC